MEQFRRIGDDLAGNRIPRIGTVDQLRQGIRHGHGIASGNSGQRRLTVRRRQTVLTELRRRV
jgi:hypothetical protein